jgi:hypothetical protein
MNDTRAWLEGRVHDAPERLRERMFEALQHADPSLDIATQLAQAAESCLRAALQESGRPSAIHLLAADALLTHACEAAALHGTLAELTHSLDFDHLLPAQ